VVLLPYFFYCYFNAVRFASMVHKPAWRHQAALPALWSARGHAVVVEEALASTLHQKVDCLSLVLNSVLQATRRDLCLSLPPQCQSKSFAS